MKNANELFSLVQGNVASSASLSLSEYSALDKKVRKALQWCASGRDVIADAHAALTEVAGKVAAPEEVAPKQAAPSAP